MNVNSQPISKQDIDADGYLRVVRIWKTIQGEGPFAGMPAIFVRLEGCNLQCPFCDTDYTSHHLLMTPVDVWKGVKELAPPGSLVVLTGGEPFRQNLIPLINLLNGFGYIIQIETNGTLFYPNQEDVWWRSMVTLVGSPKTAKIDARIALLVHSYKYVL